MRSQVAGGSPIAPRKREGRTERVKIELDPKVSEVEIYGKSKVVADVTIVSEPRGKGAELRPVKIFIRKIY
ncbi:hypothetical protein HK414_22565 [Ramlibacter terrae]|uniref:Uncharacterized protein n=1 Tax=Ramlibacter terrae TaxID=2732511 RepID=A0ABX6NZG9_9BURK|nr:hypothetical protein HK414_22565 [Ramlibacter terrae]